jgi:two-component system, chemotaxis family, chemotaxis protein CheY
MGYILVIDDDPDLRQTMRRILERGGHTVQEAENGLAGLRMVEREPPLLVVTDLLMPEKEGIETIMELRERFPRIGVVAVSGAGGVDEAGPLVDAELFGADATLSKPFDIESFLETVERVLASR